MIIYNILFKGVEKNYSSDNYALAHKDYKEACDYVEESMIKKGLIGKSTSGFIMGGDENTPGSLTDYRCEDTDGNSYYYVIYVQEV
jgi:hypothetical protein